MVHLPGWRLGTAENLHKVADADFLISHKVQEAQPRPVAKRLKEPLNIKGFFLHLLYICRDVCERNQYSRLSEYEEALCQSSFWSW
jgi:hypothetical protein